MTVIPKIIHQVWVGSDPPEHLQEYMETWRAIHPDWDYMLWTDDEVCNVNWRFQAWHDRAEEVAGKFAGQFRADLLRYEILLDVGGVYVDVDFECLKPLDAILEGVSAFCAWEFEPRHGHRGWLNNAIMGARLGHGWLSELTARLPAHLGEMLERGQTRPNILTGPQFLTPVTRRFLKDGAVKAFPSALFYPYLWNELHRNREEFAGAIAVHHWENQRKIQGKEV
jgi:inositol phosphorylceramide mannosyltransferase catalytic subunit